MKVVQVGIEPLPAAASAVLITASRLSKLYHLSGLIFAALAFEASLSKSPTLLNISFKSVLSSELLRRLATASCL